MFPDTQLFIDGRWRDGAARESGPVFNPATGEEIARVAFAEIADLDEAVAAATRAFATWRTTPAFDRYSTLRRAAGLLRERAPEIARVMTREQGKPLSEAEAEATRGADAIEWFAEEGRRLYGRIVPSRATDIEQLVLREPVGPTAAFTPWNFPINQAVRKLSAALATGCTMVLKGPENTPASCAALVQVFADAGVPAGVIGLVFGDPAAISNHLLAHPSIRKISFTGSTAVGKELAAMAGRHMKRVTLELGGHAPVIVTADADIASAAWQLAETKFRNAGQICTSPTRFLIERPAYAEFADRFAGFAASIRVGDGMAPDTQMGPLAHRRRVEAMAALVADAVERGAENLAVSAPERPGYFYQPTVLVDVAADAWIMNEEPFGPVAPIRAFDDLDEALAEANRLPVGLAAYAFTGSAAKSDRIAATIESGMVAINQLGLGGIEMPFGGIRDSGYGSEGGPEGMDPYLVVKTITRRRHAA